MTEIDAKVQNQRIEQQADDLDQIKKTETQNGLVFFLEIDVSVQEETAQDAAVKCDDIGPQIRDVAVEKGKESKLHAGADNAEQGI